MREFSFRLSVFREHVGRNRSASGGGATVGFRLLTVLKRGLGRHAKFVYRAIQLNRMREGVVLKRKQSDCFLYPTDTDLVAAFLAQGKRLLEKRVRYRIVMYFMADHPEVGLIARAHIVLCQFLREREACPEPLFLLALLRVKTTQKTNGNPYIYFQVYQPGK